MAAKKRAKVKAKKAAPKKKTAAKRKPAAKKKERPSVVHWEVQARDPARQQQFFATLFGWEIDTNNPMAYGMVESGGRDAINGGIGATQDAPRVTVYIQVSDINEILQRVETLGGRTVMPRTDLGMIIMGQFQDPEGNIIGVVEGD